jgi:hypothetical protein
LAAVERLPGENPGRHKAMIHSCRPRADTQIPVRLKETKMAKKKAKAGSPVPAAGATVACWEDDPGDPQSHPSLNPITVEVPNQSAKPLPFKIGGPAPAPAAYQPGTKNFLYYAAAAALRRTADFWGSIVPSGTQWQVGATLAVDVDSGVDLNAFYTRGDGQDAAGLHFFHDSVSGRVYFSGESPDVACHEMGHAVLDALQPQLFDAQTIEAAAFHESFGDMSALLSGLQVASFRQAVIADTGGVLNRASRLSRLAEQLGFAIRVQHPDAVDRDCLRNATNSFFYRDPQTLPPNAPATALSSEPHSFSRVFTGGFLDALAGMFNLQATKDADGLEQVSRDMAQILVGGILQAAVVSDFYSQVAAQMLQFGEGAPFNGKYRDVLKSAFVRRGVLSLQGAATVTAAKRQAPARLAAVAQSRTTQVDLPKASIAAGHYGLTQSVLKVHLAAQPKTLGVTSSSLLPGEAEPHSAQSAAESYTEDLFQRGHVDVGKHAHPQTGLVHPHSFKTHAIVEENGELVLKRITFDCGFDQGRRVT